VKLNAREKWKQNQNAQKLETLSQINHSPLMGRKSVRKKKMTKFSSLDIFTTISQKFLKSQQFIETLWCIQRMRTN
jgi:hypothetical protein